MPGKEDATSPPKPRDAEATDSPAAAAAPDDAVPSTTEPAVPTVLRQQHSDAAVPGQQQETTVTAPADGQPAALATVEQEAALPPVAPAAEAEEKPRLEPPQRQQKPSNGTTPPLSPPLEATEDTDTGDGDSDGADTPKQMCSVRQALLREQSDVAGHLQQTVKEATQPDAPTTEGPVLSTLPPPPEPPSREEKVAPASEAGNQLPALPPMKQERVGGIAGEEASRNAGPTGDQSVPADPANKEKNEDEAQEAGKPQSPPRRHKSPPRAESQGGGAGAREAGAAPSPLKKKFQKAIKTVKCLMSWYNGHRSSPRKDGDQAGPVTEEGKGGETKVMATAPEEEKGGETAKAEPPISGLKKGSLEQPEKHKDEDQQEAPPLEPAEQPLPPESQAGAGANAEKAGAASRPIKRFQEAIKRVLEALAFRKKPQSGQEKDDNKDGETKPPTPPTDKKGGKHETEPPATEDEKGGKGKAERTSSGQEKESSEQEKPPHPKWAEEEKRLEKILEEAFTKLLATEYKTQLRSTKQRQCLLTFSIFEPASQVKKQTMIYWWVAQFNLPLRPSDPPKQGKNSAPSAGKTKAPAAGNNLPAAAPPDNKATHDDQSSKKATHDDDKLHAEGILSKLSDLGFIEPIKNYCCGVIHGCKVNPLVHWMLKRLARDEHFADLDEDGRPMSSQPSSKILCLTASYRQKLQQMRIAEIQAKSIPKAPSRTPSTRGPDQESSVKAKSELSRATSIKSTTKAAEKMETKDVALMAEDKSKVKRETSLQRQTKIEEQTQDQQKIFSNEEIKGKQVILNIDAHVYPFSNSLFEHLYDCLTVLQLGQWWYHEDKTLMKVDGLNLESIDAMKKLTNIRYLSLRGLSGLSRLPYGIQKLKNLEFLDVRGCQNLEIIAKDEISSLKRLTHLDLTECYMLEHIGQGITSLTNLQVFKGFVFGLRTQGKAGCRIYHLQKLHKLQKLTICITTDSYIRNSDLKDLKKLKNLRSLTITWSEIPGILEDKSESVKKKRIELLKIWTSFELPQELEKLDLRCYPDETLQLKEHKKLKKLYLRGGCVKEVSIPSPNFVTILRLRYLKEFAMKWDEIKRKFENIKHVEIRNKDEKFLEYKDFKEKDQKHLKSDIEKEHQMIEKMSIPKFVLDENGVWSKDTIEEEYQKYIDDAKKKGEAQGSSEASKGLSLLDGDIPSTNKDTTAIQDANKDIGKLGKGGTDNNGISDTQTGKDDQVPTQEMLDSNQNKIVNQTSNLQ